MEGFGSVKIFGMVIEDIHILQFLRNNYFFLQQGSDQLISQGSKGMRDVFDHLKINDRHFLAFGTLIESSEVVDSCEL